MTLCGCSGDCFKITYLDKDVVALAALVAALLLAASAAALTVYLRLFQLFIKRNFKYMYLNKIVI
jgi:hypothetical protein